MTVIACASAMPSKLAVGVSPWLIFLLATPMVLTLRQLARRELGRRSVEGFLPANNGALQVARLGERAAKRGAQAFMRVRTWAAIRGEFWRGMPIMRPKVWRAAVVISQEPMTCVVWSGPLPQR